MNAFRKTLVFIGATALVLAAVAGCQNPLQVGLGDKVDLDVPDVALTSHPAGEYLSGTVTLSGVFTDDFEVASVTLSFDGGSTAAEATLNAADLTWEYVVDTSAYPDGETEVLLTVTDGSGKSVEKRILYYFDNTAPIVMVTLPQNYDVNEYNGNITVKGEAADQFGLSVVEYRLLDAGGAEVQTWTEADGTSSWSALFDSRDYIPGAGQIQVEMRAVDRAGNISSTIVHYDDVLSRNNNEAITAEALLKILRGEVVTGAVISAADLVSIEMDALPLQFDQTKDEPTFIISNPDENSPITDNILSAAPRLTGSVEDDAEGVDPASIQYRITSGGGTVVVRDWTNVTSTSGTGLLVRWTADVVGLTDGDHELQVRADDLGTASGISSLVPFRVDTGAPSIAVTSPSQGSYENGTFSIVGTASDQQGVTGVDVSVDGGTIWLPATLDVPGATDVNWNISIDPAVQSLSDGPLSVKVQATDGISTGTFNLQLVLDRQVPTGLFTSPAATSSVNGQVTFRGTASDDNQVTLVEIKVGASDPFVDTGGLYNWEYTVDSASYANATHATETPPASNVWKLDVELRVTDVANNQKTETGYFIYIDNDLDKPTVTFISPDDGQRVAGPLTVTGTAIDDDGVDRVEMQLDVDNDGAYTSLVDLNGDLDTLDLYEDESVVYTLTGTTLWSREVNSTGELYAADSGAGNVTIKVWAVDIGGTYGNSVERSVTFDDTIPRADNLNLASGDYVKGTFTLTADIIDDTEVRAVKISYDGGQNYVDLVSAGVVTPDGIGNITKNSAVDFTLNMAIDTTSTLPGLAGPITSDVLYLRLRVEDDANYQNLSYINLNVDNVFPTGTWDSVAADPQEIDSATALAQGTATDSGTISGIGGVDVYFVRGGNILNLSTGAGVAAVNYDFGDGDGPVPYTPSGTVDPTYVISIDDTDELGNDGGALGDGDGHDESLTVSGSTYTWWARFDSTVIPDGTLDVHYVVNDSAGNGNHYVVSGFIKNNRPSITALTVGTDLDFSGVVEGDETAVYSAALPVRQRLYVNIDASDPLGGIASYEVRRQSDDSLVATDPPGGDYDAGAEVDVTGETEDATVGLYALVTDTDGITARQDFDIVIDNDDAVNPAITLDPITTSSVVDGHVEAAGESSYDNATPDADVSGTIALTGTVSDDQRIQFLYLTIAGYDGGAGAGNQFQVASWNVGAGLLQADVPELTITSQTLDASSGHQVDFSYSWNSALITNSVATNVAIAVEGQDFGSTTVNATDSTQVDVVPYISSVSTPGGIKDANIRSMDGYYSIATSTVGATITINGFNLRPTAASVKVSSDPAGAGGISLGNVVVAGDYKSVTTDANSTGSGYLTVISDVGPAIPSINNTNSNLLTQNEEDDTFAKNLTLTDDRYIRFFTVYNTGILNGYYADMMMEDGPDADSDPDLPVFGFVDDNASFDLTLAREAVTNESPFTTVREPLSRGLGWLQHGMGRDDGGSYFHVSTYNFSTGHQILFHDTYAGDFAATNSGIDAGGYAGTASPYWTGYTGDYVQNNNNDAIQMDWNQYAPGLLMNRYIAPKITAKGNSVTGNAQVYLSFYDSNEGALIFRDFQVGQSATPLRTGMNDAGQSNLTERTNVAAGDPSRWSVTTSATGYFDMVVTDNDEVAFIYYNQSAGKIELVYTSTAAGNTTPASVTGADPQTTVNFSAATQINKAFTGTYLSATIETDGNPVTPDPIHIAAHDSANGDLIYIKLDSITDTTPEIVTVDQHLSVGIWTDIEVDSTGVPYITYYNNSENGTRDSVKLAWYKGDPSLAINPGVDGSGYVTGNWEAMTIPANDTPNGGIAQFQRVNLDFEDLDNATAGITLSPVVGYLSNDLEYAKILPSL